MAPATDDPPPLMTRLRAASRAAHRASTVSALAATAAVAAAPGAYRDAVLAFALIYTELEATITAGRLAVPRLGALHCPPLYRAAALSADVTYHWGGDAAAAAAALAAPPSPAVAAYVAYVRALRAARPPVGLIGVATAMHIAPAAGGSTLARILSRTLRLPASGGGRDGKGDGGDGGGGGGGDGGGGGGTPGLAVFAYPGVDVPRVRRAYEEGVNALALSEAEVAAVVAARTRVFALNDAVFVEVAAAAARRGAAATGRAVAAVAVAVGGVWWARHVVLGSVGVLLGMA